MNACIKKHNVLKVCETWFLILRDKHRLRVPRRIFGPKTAEVMGDWKNKLYDEKINNMYSSPHIISMIKSRRMR
jgi:hypothetical protein